MLPIIPLPKRSKMTEEAFYDMPQRPFEFLSKLVRGHDRPVAKAEDAPEVVLAPRKKAPARHPPFHTGKPSECR